MVNEIVCNRLSSLVTKGQISHLYKCLLHLVLMVHCVMKAYNIYIIYETAKCLIVSYLSPHTAPPLPHQPNNECVCLVLLELCL